MTDVTAAADNAHVPQRRFALWSVLLVVAALAFVSALIASSGRISPGWILYLLPILIGAIAYDVPGAIVSTAIAAVALLLVAPPESISVRLPELVLGLAVFLVCGVIVGLQARRQRGHAQSLERASLTDPLTGLRKPEAFFARLANEMRRADRYGSELGLVFVRVEGFDEFTQVFGRYKADLMLEHLANVIRLAVRDTDVLGRTGPTSFAVALPHGGEGRADAVAVRIASATSAAEFEGDALEPVTTCQTTTASACYPTDASNQHDLVDLVLERLDAESASRTQVADIAHPAEEVP